MVLVERNLQLIWNDKLLLASLTLQSPFMVLVVKLTADPNCFTSNLVNIGSRTALFVFSRYGDVYGHAELLPRDLQGARDHPARGIRRRQPARSRAEQGGGAAAGRGFAGGYPGLGFVSIVHVPQNHLLLETDMEIFITVLLTMFSSSCIGLLISALFTSGESAILAVLVLMIGQVVFSNIMFTVTGRGGDDLQHHRRRWGMGALGASTDLNSRMAWLQAGLDGPMYDATVET